MKLDAKVPAGPLAGKWDRHRFESRLVNPANRRRFDIIVVGSGLAGASAAASLGELGYNVKCVTIHDSPRRAHSIAAQGGINAAKNYQNDGDSVYRLFYDTIKGGDYRSREANVHRLAEVSVEIIDQCAAQGVPFAREYGGTLWPTGRSAGRRSRAPSTRAARPASSSCSVPTSSLDAPGRPRRSPSSSFNRVKCSTSSWSTAKRPRDHHAQPGDRRARALRRRHRVLLATGGYGNVYYLSTNAGQLQRHRRVALRYKRGAGFANPCFTQIHPTCIRSQRRVSSPSSP